jgi:hypothetical protein
MSSGTRCPSVTQEIAARCFRGGGENRTRTVGFVELREDEPLRLVAVKPLGRGSDLARARRRGKHQVALDAFHLAQKLRLGRQRRGIGTTGGIDEHQMRVAGAKNGLTQAASSRATWVGMFMISP